jgi:hypothetical protein
MGDRKKSLSQEKRNAFKLYGEALAGIKDGGPYFESFPAMVSGRYAALVVSSPERDKRMSLATKRYLRTMGTMYDDRGNPLALSIDSANAYLSAILNERAARRSEVSDALAEECLALLVKLSKDCSSDNCPFL